MKEGLLNSQYEKQIFFSLIQCPKTKTEILFDYKPELANKKDYVKCSKCGNLIPKEDFERYLKNIFGPGRHPKCKKCNNTLIETGQVGREVVMVNVAKDYGGGYQKIPKKGGGYEKIRSGFPYYKKHKKYYDETGKGNWNETKFPVVVFKKYTTSSKGTKEHTETINWFGKTKPYFNRMLENNLIERKGDNLFKLNPGGFINYCSNEFDPHFTPLEKEFLVYLFKNMREKLNNKLFNIEERGVNRDKLWDLKNFNILNFIVLFLKKELTGGRDPNKKYGSWVKDMGLKKFRKYIKNTIKRYENEEDEKYTVSVPYKLEGSADCFFLKIEHKLNRISKNFFDENTLIEKLETNGTNVFASV